LRQLTYKEKRFISTHSFEGSKSKMWEIGLASVKCGRWWHIMSGTERKEGREEERKRMVGARLVPFKVIMKAYENSEET
jgi:hypothetical protein